MTKPNRKEMEQLSVGKYKHTNIPTWAPPRDGSLPGSFVGKTRTQYNTTEGLVVATIQWEDSYRVSSDHRSVKQPGGRRLVWRESSGQEAPSAEDDIGQR